MRALARTTFLGLTVFRTTNGSHTGAQFAARSLSFLLGAWHMADCPYFPSRGISLLLVKPTTVAPCIVPYALTGTQNSGTRALRFVASAHIPTGKLQWKRRLVSARNPVVLPRIKITAAQPTHYRQAKGNSRNLLTIATAGAVRQHTGTRIADNRCFLFQEHCKSGLMSGKRPRPQLCTRHCVLQTWVREG